MKSKSEMIEESKIQNSSSLFSINEANTLLQQEENYYHVNKFVGIDQSNFKVMHKKLSLHKRSITPDTLKKVIFKTSEEDVHYQEYYEHKGNEVGRFAINYSNIKANLEDKTILKEAADLIDTTQQVKKSVKSSQYKLEDAQKISHHGLEKYILQQAINQLLESEGKTVLVDIFARENGAIKILEDSVPETHTVVLYKNPAQEGKHEIVVIDPSNFLFSSHLFNLNGTVNHGLLSKITTLHKGLQIYTPVKENIGSNPDQWRECIDISVKLAFALNKETEDFKIDLANITKYDFVQLISNIDSVDKSIISSNIPYSSRIKQSSDINEVKKFKVCTETINKKQKIAFSFNKELSRDIGVKYNDSLKCDKYDEIIKSLLNLFWVYSPLLAA
jgi:hypothetical protein